MVPWSCQPLCIRHTSAFTCLVLFLNCFARGPLPFKQFLVSAQEPRLYHAMPSLIPASVLHFPRIFLQVQLKSICEYEPNCKYDQGLCSVADSEPNALFRHLLIMDTILIAVKEFIKVVVLFFFLCRGYVPVQVHFFCANSPIACLLALVYQPVRVLHLRRPSVFDFVLQLLFDGLCEDIPQLLLQIYFVYSVSRTGLSVLQVLSLFLTTLGFSCIILRLTVQLLKQCWKTRLYQLPTQMAQNGATLTNGSFTQFDPSLDLAAAVAVAIASTVAIAAGPSLQGGSCSPSPNAPLSLAKDVPGCAHKSQIPIPGQIEARDNACYRTSHLSLQSFEEESQHAEDRIVSPEPRTSHLSVVSVEGTPGM